MSPSPEVQRARELLSYLVSKPDATMDDYRDLYDEVCSNFELPADAETTDVDADGVPCIWVGAPGADPSTVIVHVHGGGFCMGSAKGYRELGYRLSKVIGGRSLVVDYRLAPEHPFPAPVDDVVTAYRFARRQPGVDRVVLTGDSAGGGMILSAMIMLREAGDPLPVAAVAMSPLVDLAGEGGSVTERADRDPLPVGVLVEAMGGAYRGADIDPKHPVASPLYGDLGGLPPTLVLVGTEEGLHDDSVRLVERLRSAGVETELIIGEGMIHIWPVFAFLPEAVEATDRVGAHVRQRLGAPA